MKKKKDKFKSIVPYLFGEYGSEKCSVKNLVIRDDLERTIILRDGKAARVSRD
jgi:hypothetical protein